MLNLAAAKSASLAATQLKGSNITNALPQVPLMAKTEVQNTGVYDLIFQYVHTDYPTREEVVEYITKLVAQHHTSNFHLPVGMSVTPSPGSPLGIPGTTTIPPLNKIPKEIIIKQVKVRSGSPVNSIGYGI